tara:strand:+ start:317 stop:532 length:216 start_codon:yes stop_codon:yes gene_type:complete
MPGNFPPLEIILIEQQEDGDYYVEFDITDEFVEWFKKDQGLKRWSNKRFEKWVSQTIEEIMAQQELNVDEK